MKRLRVVFILLIILNAGGCANSLLLWPPHGRLVTPSKSSSVSIPLQQGQLEILTQVTDEPSLSDAYVLEFCGNATPAQDVIHETAHRWRNAATEVWVVNYPGFGASTGPAKLCTIPSAALLAYDELAKKAGPHPIYLAGTSLGTTAALYVAVHRRTAGILLQNPPPLRELIFGNYGWWNLWIAPLLINPQIPRELDSIENASHVSVPAVFVLADDDTLVPPPFQNKVVDAFAGMKRLVVLKGAGHSSKNSDAQEAEIEKMIRWMLQMNIKN